MKFNTFKQTIGNNHLASAFMAFSFLVFFALVVGGCQKNKKEEPKPDTIINPDTAFVLPTLQKPNVPFFFQSFYKEPPDNPNTIEGVALGKALFFDKILSDDNTVACASCHNPEKAFTDGIPLAIGIQGKTGRRNTPGLFNIAIQKKFFWDGRDTSLEQQSLHPIQDPNEMALNLNKMVEKLKANANYPKMFGRAFGTTSITPDRVAKALAQFERTLFSQNSKYDLYLKQQYNPTAEELKGMQLFFQHPDPFAPVPIRGGNCGDCHLQSTLFGKPDAFFGFHNNGLTELTASDIGLQKVTGKASDFGKFKTPGLRNIALTAPYMHDGRFQTLEQVLDHYNSEDIFTKPKVDPLIQLGTNERFGESLKLTANEKTAIIAFLHMLTDSTAIKFTP